MWKWRFGVNGIHENNQLDTANGIIWWFFTIRSKTTDIPYYQYDRFTIPSYKPGKLKRARLTTNFKNLNHLILWRYPVEKTKRVSNRWADEDSKTREQKVGQIYTCREIKSTARYKTASQLNHKVQIRSVNHRLINKRKSLLLLAIIDLYLSKRNRNFK